MEEKRADAAEDKGAKASREQAKKHAEALSQQKRADAIEKELVLCSEKGKCDESKKKDLKEQVMSIPPSLLVALYFAAFGEGRLPSRTDTHHFGPGHHLGHASFRAWPPFRTRIISPWRG
jgi:hypothetical protein